MKLWYCQVEGNMKPTQFDDPYNIWHCVLERLIININIKEFGQITLFLRSYSIMNTNMSDFK